MSHTARLLPQTETFGVPTWPLHNLTHTAYVAAQFLMPGEIIERKSLMFRVTLAPLASHVEPGRVVICVENEQGGIQTLVITAGVEVPIFEVES